MNTRVGDAYPRATRPLSVGLGLYAPYSDIPIHLN